MSRILWRLPGMNARACMAARAARLLACSALLLALFLVLPVLAAGNAGAIAPPAPPAREIAGNGGNLVIPVAAAILAFCAGGAVATLLCLRRAFAAERRERAADAACSDMRVLLDAAPEALVFWPADGGAPMATRRLRDLLPADAAGAGWDDLRAALDPEALVGLDRRLAGLRAGGGAFALQLALAGGGIAEVRGEAVRNARGHMIGHALWLADGAPAAAREAAHAAALADLGRRATRILASADRVPFPVWRRDADLRLVWVNSAYAEAVETSVEAAVAGEGVEFASRLVAARARDLAADALARDGVAREKRYVVVGGQRRAFDVMEIPLGGGGTFGFAIDVGELDEARAALARHVEGHSETLDRLGTAIAIFGPDKRLAFFNSAYARLWKIPEDWLEGEPHESEVLERLRETRLLPEQADFPAWKRERLGLYTTVIEPREELWHLPDGRALREVCQPHPFGGLLFFYEDVTDRLALERSHNTLVAVQGATLGKLYEGVAVFGGDGRLKLSNPAYATIWRLPPEALADGPHIAEVVELTRDLLTEDAEEWPDVRARMIQVVTEREACRGRMERPDGSVIDFAASHLPDGAMLLAYLDVTDSSRIERALRERNEALEAADRLKTDFVSNVSYELRTPLNAILGFAEILDQEYFGPLNARQRDYAQGILHASNQLLDLVNDILDLATIEAGAMVLERSSVVVADLLDGVVRQGAEQARKKQLGIEITCRLPPDATIEADGRRLRQVLVNLFSNAVKYTLPGGSISLGAAREGEGICLWIADTGIGIDPRLHERVFRMFETAGDRQRGAGIGLSLARSFIELHGGEIRLESEPGIGTRVVCALPLAPAAEDGEARRSA